jgi:hypothetical protein
MQATIERTCRSTAIDLILWLADRGISVVGSSDTGPSLDESNRLATFMGEHFQSLRPMLRMIKRSVNGRPHGAFLGLSGMPTQQVDDIMKFGAQGRRSGLFVYFYLDEHRDQVRFLIQSDPRVVAFFTGDWFERCVLERVVRRLSASGAGDDSLTLSRANIKLPDGRDGELDILVSTSERVIWLECKSGTDYSADLKRYQAIAEDCLWLPPEQAGLVILEPLWRDEKANIRLLSSMTAVNLTDLDRFLDNAIAGR